jgi:hypothetical protein
MARNSSGTHSLPATTNPVVTGTNITPTWANSTLSDLSAEITDSLSRSGKGGMTAPMRTADGSVTSPATSYTSETGSGWFRHAAGELRLAILGTYRLAVTAATTTINNALTVVGRVAAQAGMDVAGTLAIFDDGGTNKRVAVDAPTGLAANYDLVLPTALPGSTLPVTLTSAGVLSTAQLVNAQQNFGTPSAGTDVVIQSYVVGSSDSPSLGANITGTSFSVFNNLGIVTITGELAFGVTGFGAGNTLATINSGYRPLYGVRVPAYFYDASTGSNCLTTISVDTGGVVTMVGGAYTLTGWTGADALPTATTDRLYFSFSYKAA